ncbi:MAG: hypothetical protein MK207_02660 [Saprospiraceae bacterium]|nr:hypothetical protein [Saprospiraceae bacterium]
MHDPKNDLNKIATLFRSEDEPNALLGLNLCLNIDLYCCSENWLKVLEGLGTWYRKWSHLKDSQELLIIERQIVTIINKLLPEFLKKDKGYLLSGFIGSYFKSEKTNSNLINKLYESLKIKLPLHDWIVLLIKSSTTENLLTAIVLSEQVDIQEIYKKNLVILKAWSEVYILWKKEHKGNGFGRKSYYWKNEWSILAKDVISIIHRYYQQENIPEACPYTIFEILNELWQDASIVDHNKSIDNDIQSKILSIILQPSFPPNNQQKILLSHTLFNFWINPLQEISAMPGDCDLNLFDKKADTVVSYINNFSQFHQFLNADILNASQKQNYLRTIKEIWTYYYIPEILPYIEYTLNWNDLDPCFYFYLGQLYHGFSEKKTQAINFYKRYIELAPDEIADNNFFISEMSYKTRCYQPSILEAYSSMGQLYETLGEPDIAIECYEIGILKGKDHHQAPFLNLIKLLQHDYNNKYIILDLALKYYDIFYYKTDWINKSSYIYNTSIDAGKNRNYWIKKYDYFTVINDINFDRKIGHSDLNSSMLYLFFNLAEWLYYEKQNLKKAWEACLKADECLNLKLSYKPFQHKKYPIPTLPVSQEDVLYLQAQLVVELYKDYWQAQSLYSKILQLSPNHRMAKKGLEIVRLHIGY